MFFKKRKLASSDDGISDIDYQRIVDGEDPEKVLGPLDDQTKTELRLLATQRDLRKKDAEVKALWKAVQQIEAIQLTPLDPIDEDNPYIAAHREGFAIALERVHIPLRSLKVDYP